MPGAEETERRAGTGRRRRGAAAEPLLLGVRHHGPGSARAVRAALDAALPRAVLIEGPPEADALIPLAADEEMRPPVALLAHAVDEPGRSAFWPLAEFSPEWVALRWALDHGVPARFIDLPATHTLAWSAEGEESDEGAESEEGPEGAETAERRTAEQPDAPADVPSSASTDVPPDDAPADVPPPDVPPDASAEAPADVPTATPGADVRVDPLAVLAGVAGYDDPERWWEDVIEHRGAGAEGDPFAPFTALEEAMGSLREVYGSGGHDRDLMREAYMRLQVRAAQREFGGGVAVVCGAWHVPALRRRSTVTADRALLKGLPKVKADLTWVPWTYRRLARAGGYGAGIDSPGWYGHLFAAPDRPVERWMTKVAGLLREEGRIVSAAHVIEAVRLADTLAALRGRPLPGLGETTDAVRAVMCDGSDVPLALVRDRLVVGDAMGEVPPAAPAVPLQRDLARLQRGLRLKPEAQERELELDLRKETDAGRSRLLHRLRLLGVPWGEPAVSRGGTGTFRETWRLRWEPELAVRVAEAGVWGTTVLGAATAKAEADAVAAQGLAEVTALAEHCLLAGLPDALPAVMRILADRAALDTDVGRLAEALPALVRSLRYGDVRGTDTGALAEVAAGLADRVFVGLPPACAALDADAAEEMRRHLDAVHGAVGLLAETAARRPAASGSTTEAQGTTDPAPRPAPANPSPAPANPSPAPVDPSPAPVDPSPAPVDPSPAPVDPSPAPVDPSPAPVDPSPAPVDPSPAPTGLRPRWQAVLRVLSGRDRVPGVIRGRAVRLLLDDGVLDPGEAARLMGLALSPGTPPGDAAAWIEGFIGGGGGGMLLVHDERLLGLVDTWLTRVPADAFTDVLPLLRRTFSAYEAGVRRTLGELVKRGPGARGSVAGTGAGLPGFAAEWDLARADAVVPVVRLLLGLAEDGSRTDAGDDRLVEVDA
ncbi:DUF5682 family protein [Streptomyces sp. NPDC052687]|uniref:DUF5682 family protein n=1 Tax=Streptomyces sp. NPDC052687 TaxID=3154759 RepID=UPI003431A000